MSTLRTKTVNAAAWVMGGRILSQTVSFVIGIILARLLIPDHFGLVAMALFFTGAASLLADIGFGSALIQKRDITDIHYSTVFWFNLGVAALLSATIFSLANPIAGFYDREELVHIVQLLSVNFILSGLSLVPRHRLAKNLRFKYISVADFLGMLTGGLTAIVLAVKGFTFYSLVVQLIVNRAITTLVVVLSSRWRPSFKFSLAALRELIGFSASVFGTQVVRYIGREADKLLVGKYIGGPALGIYDKAYSIMLFPLHNISHVIGSVMFPSLSEIQHDKPRVREIYLRCTAAIAVITFPMMAGIYAVSEPFVHGVLGEQWIELIPVLQIFTVAGVFTSIVTVTGAVYLSQGAAGLQLRVNLVTKTITIGMLIAGLQWGLLGVTVAFTLASALNSMITLGVAGGLIGLSIPRLFKNLAPAIPPTLLMLASVLLVKHLMDELSPILTLAIQVLAGGCSYLALVLVFKTPAFFDLLSIARNR